MMPPNELVFAPEPMKLRAEILYALIGVGVFGPLLCWWKNISLKAAVLVLVGTLVFCIARELWRRRRGRDFVYIVPEGIRVTNKRKVWLLRWAEIQAVHRFREQLVFETVPPHRRETLDLAGHDHHDKELARAIAAHARNVIDMKWFDTVSDVL